MHQAMSIWRPAASLSCAARTSKVACRRSFSTSRANQRQIGIADLLQQDQEEEDVEVHGWVRSVRKQKRIAFVHLGDGSSIEPVQAVLKPEQAAELSTGTAVKLQGTWKASQGGKQSYELQVSQTQVMGENDAESNPLQPKYQTPEYLRTIPHLRPRIPANTLLLRLRSQVIASVTKFFNDEGYVQTHTPIITSSDCEGAGEVFTVSSNASRGSEQKSTQEDEAQVEHFFRSPKYLTVSAQLHLEALAQAVGKVWTLSPTFRAEKSDTPRHLSEFYMLEAELCFTQDMSQIMDLVENMLRTIALDLQSSKTGTELLQIRQPKPDEPTDTTSAETLQQRWTGLIAPSWPRITYTTAIQTLHSAQTSGSTTFAFPPTFETGLQAEHERYLASTLGKGSPLFITDYPLPQKPFYMPPSPSSSKTASCFDLLVPDLCELVGGSMRESNSQALLTAMQEKNVAGKNLDWYQDLRRYGSVPRGGFGLGFDRLLCYLSGVGNVRDVVAFPRWVGRCDC